MKTCAWCGKSIARRPGEPSYEVKRRKYCDQNCANRATNARLYPDVKIERFCAACGASLVRRLDERKGSFLLRKTCGKSCKRALVRSVRRYELGEKPCVACGAVFSRRHDESIQSFRKRETCSRECAVERMKERLRIPVIEDRDCAACGQQLERRPGEGPFYFNRRRVCSRRCWTISSALKGRNPLNPYPPDWTAELRRSIRERDGYACQSCGVVQTDEQHDVHHIDYVKVNLDPMNLMTLCKSCHAATNSNRDYWQARLTAFMRTRHGGIAA